MSIEENSSNTPAFSSVNQSFSRADVAIGNVTQHVMVRSVSPVIKSSQADVSHTDVTNSYGSGTFAPVNLSAAKPVTAIQPSVKQSSEPETTPESTPKSSRIRILVPAISGIAFVIFCGALAGFIHWHGRRNNPNTIFNDALTASLSTTQLQENTHASSYYNVADFDFSNMANPVVSTQQTLIESGSQFKLAGYGTAKNTYISYMNFPSNISSSIKSMITNGWVQIRSNGQLPKNASQALDNVADPRYQDIGLVSFGNFNENTRTQLVNYINSEHIYDFQPSKVSHTEVNNEKVLAYPVSININYLKIYDENIAYDEGFTPNDVASAVNDLNNWTHAKAMFYVSDETHRFVAVDLKQGTTNTRLSFTNYNNDTLPQEPVTNLNWQDFAPVQQLIEQQASARPPSSKYSLKSFAHAVPLS